MYKSLVFDKMAPIHMLMLGFDDPVTYLFGFICTSALITVNIYQFLNYHEVHQLECLESGEEDSEPTLARMCGIFVTNSPDVEFHSVRMY